MPKLTNMTKATQGVRIDGRMRWVKPGESIEGQPEGRVPYAFRSKPDDKPVKAPEAPKPEPEDPLAGLTDDELRTHIEDKTNEKPHHRASRAKLLEIARGL